MAILGALLAIGAIIRAFFWHGRDEDRYGTEEKKTRLIWLVIAVVLAIIGFIVFFFTEDVSLPIRFVDIWTIANAVIFIAGIISVILAFKREEKDFQVNSR
ncbi:MAG: PLDc N-terminal domain-containing protein [Dehalococcoidia bacterium]|nr:PLDc N-terminal domain-containing protein [Dehalococcoidia bacterium]